MRIAYVCTDPGVPVFGCKGASIHVQEVLRALVRTGADITLLSRRFDGDAPPDLRAVRIAALEPAAHSDPVARERALLAGNHTARRALEKLGPLDLVYERHALWSFGAMEHARDAGIPSALEVNAPLVQEQSRYRTLTLRDDALAAARRALAAAGRVFCVSRAVAQAVMPPAADAARFEVLPNGVDALRFRPDILPALPPADAITIGFVGSLRPWHGLDLLIDAFARLARESPRWRLLIVGDGPMMPALREDLGARCLLDRTILTGAVPPSSVPSWLASMDIAAAPYPPDQPDYFSPLKLFEYMASGRAIVAARLGQTAEVIEHDRTGLLVTPGDVGALADALRTLGHDPARSAALGRAARARAVAAHSWTSVVERVLEYASSPPQPLGAIA
ncbi:GDP-mannose-dependent alpha-(1-6)-phosphatidylinositol monomannoside mannosyltransferase [Phycisphaerales bacterium]|nr:GDP-mannose-dependent alpha-(1-6)-phosphatidylinositol monomannoside mannosyltransferase [Phycisphaerales bacterium]